MSSFSKFSALAFASAVLAKPWPQAYNYGNAYGHQSLHSSAAPYATANTTAVYSASPESTSCSESLSAPAYSTSETPVYSAAAESTTCTESLSSPIYSTPSASVYSSPSSPVYSSPSAPGYSAPSSPVYSSASVPGYSGPSSPVYSSPSSPVYSTPSSPVYSSPSAPGYSAPSSPVYSSASVPGYSGPSSPVYSSPSSPVYSTPSSPVYSSPFAPGYSAPSYSQGQHSTWTSTQYHTVTKTLSQVYPSGGTSVSAGGYGSSSASVCIQGVTVTTTKKVYITVTAGYHVPSSPVNTYSSSSYSAPSAPAYSAPSSPSAPVYSAPSSSAHSYSAPSSSAQSYSSPAYSSPAAPVYTAPVKAAGFSSSTAPAAATSSSTGSTSGGKRGLAYNSADILSCFDDSKEITWAYNWVSASAGLPSNFNYIPELHDGSVVFTSVWSVEAAAAIATGSTTLFSFNEPDQPSQANMSPEDAAQAYQDYMNPFAGKANLCAPAVTNGPASENMGLGWLQNFIDACAGNCHIDCYNIHYYNPTVDVQGFKDQVNAAISMAGDKPVWVGEFGIQGASDDEITGFLEEVMPWMDSMDQIAGYAYFMAADGQLISGSEPSSYGSTYMSYTS